MLITRITQLGITKSTLLHFNLLPKPSIIYPGVHTTHHIYKDVCPGKKGAGGGSASGKSSLKRALKTGPCRMCFVPEEWFLFFHSKTGVSGPYLFGIALANYMMSKEIFIMEHEYYLGLSISIVLYLVVTRLGPEAAAALDYEVDAVCNEFEQTRKAEVAHNESVIKQCKDMQWRAEGQKDLITAKKENIAMQLEAEYRERMMLVYRSVRGRMDYHVKRYRSEARIQQKWMIGWILENVNKSITPEFQQQALTSAIQELSSAKQSSQSKD